MASYGAVRYHTLDTPLNPKQLPNQYSDLHTLYPGRPMDQSDNYDPYNVIPEDQAGAHEMFETVKQNTVIYGDSLEQRARQQGGKDKMTVHAVDDAAQLIEDPELKFAGMYNPDSTPLPLRDMATDGGGPTGPRLRPVSGQTPSDGDDAAAPPDGVERFRGSRTASKSKEPTPPTAGWLGKKSLLLILALAALFLYIYMIRKSDMYAF